jgi:glutamate mutase epsilon subunit
MEKKQEDNELLKEMCTQYNVSFEKMEKLLATIKEYQFKDRRTGVYEALKEIIKSDLKSVSHEIQ